MTLQKKSFILLGQEKRTSKLWKACKHALIIIIYNILYFFFIATIFNQLNPSATTVSWIHESIPIKHGIRIWILTFNKNNYNLQYFVGSYNFFFIATIFNQLNPSATTVSWIHESIPIEHGIRIWTWTFNNQTDPN